VTTKAPPKRKSLQAQLRERSVDEILSEWRAMDAADRAEMIDTLRVEPDEDILRAIIAPRERAT
jgi:hypothetical protein